MSSNSGFNLNEVETVIVAVKYNGHFHWYESDRDLWVLDLEKWHADFTHAGIKGHHESNAGERFGILVVNEETAEEFLLENELIYKRRRERGHSDFHYRNSATLFSPILAKWVMAAGIPRDRGTFSPTLNGC